ncbi:MAG: hypothetical protein M3Y81_28125 [Chloroflexota bacterium]|nr:hypothetical protein [Chloroflexota bacterium]
MLNWSDLLVTTIIPFYQDLHLLIDALDEMVTGTTKEAAEASYRNVAGAIAKVATLYHRSPAVVTARKAGYYARK